MLKELRAMKTYVEELERKKREGKVQVESNEMWTDLPLKENGRGEETGKGQVDRDEMMRTGCIFLKSVLI